MNDALLVIVCVNTMMETNKSIRPVKRARGGESLVQNSFYFIIPE